MVLDYREHDRVVAAISHLPHLIASSLVNLVRDSDTAAGTMKRVAARRLQGYHRIASSSPEMWEQICMTNTLPIAEVLELLHRLLKPGAGPDPWAGQRGDLQAV